MSDRAVSVELEHATKRFGRVVAVDDASFRFACGKVHALVGENGAGKSTALALAAGVLTPDGGVVRVGGSPLVPATPREAGARGVGLVRQHFSLVDAFSALDNLVLGVEPVDALGRIDRGCARSRAATLAESVGLRVPIDAPVTGELGVGDKQRLEILRVLLRDASTLLLDEPTAVLTRQEADDLYALLRRLASEGRAVAVVTHKLDEVLRHVDQVTVLRRGRVELDAEVAATDETTLTRAIMGAEAPKPPARAPVAADAPLRLEVRARGGEPVALDVTLAVRAGEIVGVAGVEGNGQTGLVRAIAGIEPRVACEVRVDGAPVRGGPAERRAAGLVVVHEDRHRDGLVLEASVGDNLLLADRRARDGAALVERRIARFGIAPARPSRLAGELSGGNQQKIVVARALDRPIAAAVLAQPTRGVDLGAAATIRDEIAALASSGAAVVVVSADLAELHALAHRIVVVARGALVAEVDPGASDERIGRAMLGAHLRDEEASA